MWRVIIPIPVLILTKFIIPSPMIILIKMVVDLYSLYIKFKYFIILFI